MGRQLTGLGGIARVATLGMGCLMLAHCSGPLATKSSSYPPRVVEEGEPVPKGGGVQRVGRPYNTNGRTYAPNDNAEYRAEGIASWYGRDFHGRLTANREIYDMHGISAAHPTMPLPSYARVTNLDNGRSIIVRVNNRGPFVHDRIIDLSVGTAKALEFHSRGLARVRVEYVGRAPIEGSDDGMLLATLRERSPAPAPSRVMLASAKPFLPDTVDGKTKLPPSDRPLWLGGASSPSRPAVRPSTASAEASTEPPSTLSAPSFGFLPWRGDGPALGLMSGRGLY
jgi:rare lipoprotein A